MSDPKPSNPSAAVPASDHETSDARLYLQGKPISDFLESHEHVSPLASYIKVLGALFVLTGLTYAVSYADLGAASLPVAMLVAVAKATLVCMFFMHLKYENRYHTFVFLSSLLFVAIFFGFTIFDMVSRPRLNEQQETFFRVDKDRDWNDRANLVNPPPPPPTDDVAPAEGGAAEGGAAEAAAAEGGAPEGADAAGAGAAVGDPAQADPPNADSKGPPR